MPKEKFPPVIFVVTDRNGLFYASRDLKSISVYYDDHDGIDVAIYDLREVGKVTKELRYEELKDEKS